MHIFFHRVGERKGGRRQKEDKFPVKPEGGREQQEAWLCPRGGGAVEPGGSDQSTYSNRSTSQKRTATGQDA